MRWLNFPRQNITLEMLQISFKKSAVVSCSTSGLDMDHEVLKPHGATARAQSTQVHPQNSVEKLQDSFLHLTSSCFLTSVEGWVWRLLSWTLPRLFLLQASQFTAVLWRADEQKHDARRCTGLMGQIKAICHAGPHRHGLFVNTLQM